MKAERPAIVKRNAPPPKPRSYEGAARQKFVALLEEGEHFDVAARLIRMHPSSIRELMARDAEVESEIEEARATGARTYRQKLLKAGDFGKSTSHLQWLAERLYPRIYAQPKQSVALEHSGPDGGPQQHEVKATVVIDLATAERIARGDE